MHEFSMDEIDDTVNGNKFNIQPMDSLLKIAFLMLPRSYRGLVSLSHVSIMHCGLTNH